MLMHRVAFMHIERGVRHRQREPRRTIVEEAVVLIGAFPSELEVVS